MSEKKRIAKLVKIEITGLEVEEYGDAKAVFCAQAITLPATKALNLAIREALNSAEEFIDQTEGFRIDPDKDEEEVLTAEECINAFYAQLSEDGLDVRRKSVEDDAKALH